MKIMRSVPWLLTVVSAGASFGCGDDETTTGTTTTSSDPNTVTYSGVVTDGFLQVPLVGAKVCAVDTQLPCGTTDADGKYSLVGLPKNTVARTEVTADGFIGGLVMIDVKDTDRDDISGYLLGRDIAVSTYQDAGITLDLTKGMIGFALGDSSVMHGASGYTPTIAPASGDGPYFARGLVIDATLTETSDNGAAAFINVEEGDYEGTVTGPGTCTADWIEMSGPNTWPTPAKAGFLTYAVAQCPDGPGGGTAGGGGAGGGTGGAGGATGGSGGTGG